jgi:hypothetical protein
MPALDWQTPLTITLPAPQPIRTCVIMSLGWWIGASGIACAAQASDNPNKANAIVLIIISSRWFEYSFAEVRLGQRCTMESFRWTHSEYRLGRLSTRGDSIWPADYSLAWTARIRIHRAAASGLAAGIISRRSALIYYYQWWQRWWATAQCIAMLALSKVWKR